MKTKWIMTLVIAAAPIWASTHSALAGTEGSRPVSADIKGYGRDGAWLEKGWHGRRNDGAADAGKKTAPAPLAAPELAAGVAASGLALLIGGLAVARGRRPS